MNEVCNDGAVLILVPAYNAARHLEELVARIRRIVPDRHSLYVNDGSTDETLDVLRRLGVNYLSLPENQGKGAALKAGFDYALARGYRSVLTLDADLQHLPEEIAGFLRGDDGNHLILGVRAMDLKVMPLARWLTNNLTSLIISIFSCRRIRDSQSGYRLIPAELLKSVQFRSVSYDFESEMLFKAGAAGCRIAEVPITTVYDDSQSYIHPWRETGRFIRQIWRRLWY